MIDRVWHGRLIRGASFFLACACGTPVTLDAGADAALTDATVTDAAFIDDGGRDAATDAGVSCVWTTPEVNGWDPRFAAAGVTGSANAEVRAIATAPDGKVYFGGSFDFAGPSHARNVGQWTVDGGWAALGDGLEATVTALARRADGSLYAASYDGTNAALHVWDGVTWSLVANAEVGYVDELAFASDGLLWVVGTFQRIAAEDRAYVATFDPATGAWATPVVVDAAVHAVLLDDQGACIGGAFRTIDGATPARYVACRSSGVASWTPLDLAVARASSAPVVQTLARDASGALWVGGSFLPTFAGALSSHVARRGPLGWEAVGAGVDQGALTRGPSVTRLVPRADGAMYLVGDFATASPGSAVGAYYPRVALWNGTRFEEVGGVQDASLGPIVIDAALDAAGQLVIGGSFGEAFGRFGIGEFGAAANIARMTTTGLAPMRGPAPTLGILSGVRTLVEGSRCSVLVGGSLLTATEGLGNVAELNAAGELVSLGLYAQGSVQALHRSGDALYAAGDFWNSGGEGPNTVARHADGEWIRMNAGLQSAQTVTALVTGPDGALYLAGYLRIDGSVGSVYLARWDGERWNEAVATDGAVAALATFDGALYAGGTFTTVGGVPLANLVRQVDGRWEVVGSGLDGPVNSMAVHDGSLFVTGTFTNAGGQATPRIARWDGAAWHAVPSIYIAESDFPRVTVVGGALAIVGPFTLEPGGTTHHFARWDVDRWVPVPIEVTALVAAQGEHLVFGGYFASLGGVPASGLARRRGSP